MSVGSLFKQRINQCTHCDHRGCKEFRVGVNNRFVRVTLRTILQFVIHIKAARGIGKNIKNCAYSIFDVIVMHHGSSNGVRSADILASQETGLNFLFSDAPLKLGRTR